MSIANNAKAQLNVVWNSGNEEEIALSNLDLFLTMASTVKLILTAYGNWLLPFITNC